METRHLPPFFVLTFAITRGVGGAVMLFGDALTERFGDVAYDDPFWKILFHGVTYAPATSATGVVSSELVVAGTPGLVVAGDVLWRFGAKRTGTRKEAEVLADEAS